MAQPDQIDIDQKILKSSARRASLNMRFIKMRSQLDKLRNPWDRVELVALGVNLLLRWCSKKRARWVMIQCSSFQRNYYPVTRQNR